MTRVVSEGFTPPSPNDFWQPLIGNGAFAFTRPMLLMILSAAVVIGVGLAATRNLKVVPGKGQFVFESMYDFVRNTIGKEMLGEKNFLPYMPLLFSLFFMILVNNLFGVIPFLQYPTNARFGFPVALTIIVFGLYLFLGFKRRGFIGYFGSLLPEGLPWWLKPFIFFIEFLTYFLIRPVTLALRLFGNMFAGHILLLLMATGAEYMLLHGGAPLKVMSVGPFVMNIVMTFFELLVEFLQAFIFTLLAALYISDSLSDHH